METPAMTKEALNGVRKRCVAYRIEDSGDKIIKESSVFHQIAAILISKA